MYELQPFIALKEVIEKFLGNLKDPDYENIANNMLKTLRPISYFHIWINFQKISVQ